MERKTKVKLLGRTITIEHIKNLKYRGIKCWGICEDDKLKIRIEKDCSDEMYQRTLKHELMHMKLRISGLVEIISSELDEALARLAEFD